MKKLLIIIFAAVTVFLGISPFTAHAEDSSSPGSEIVDELDDILSRYDLGFTICIHAPMRIPAAVTFISLPLVRAVIDQINSIL